MQQFGIIHNASGTDVLPSLPYKGVLVLKLEKKRKLYLDDHWAFQTL